MNSPLKDINHSLKGPHIPFGYLQAFQKLQADGHLAAENCRYELVHEDRYEETWRLIADQYCPDEIFCKNFGIVADEGMKKMVFSDLQDNMSLALVSNKTNSIIGIRIIRVSKKGGQVDPEAEESEPVRKLLRFVKFYNDNLCNVFQHYDVSEVISLFQLTVHRDYRHQGLGLRLMQAALVFISGLNIGPCVVRGNCTSNYSKCIYEKCEFDTLGEIKFEDYMDNGEVVVKDTGEHKSFKMFGKIIGPCGSCS